MASSSTEPEPTTNNPASNGRPHDSASVSESNNECWTKELAQEIDSMAKRMEFMKDNLSKIQDEFVILRRSFEDIHKILNHLKELVPHEATSDASI
ncbi:hypothetical protein PMG11_08258 [Penicillium brasilianum]|uniref:Uncharacterized protein n=1 Tax=Penicillium brasilianum TaxID=104259 RepID=A0A0F7TUX8_PENBI|nr:hypothetical protein PMG11_08258 [Penicillium brasilianum]